MTTVGARLSGEGKTMKVDKRNIESFIRVRRDLGGTDQQIAAQLGSVGTTTIATWRNKFKIRPANKFRPHFTGRYGPDALERFQSMVEKGAII